MTLANLSTRYVLFAALATAANIGAQELVVRTYSGVNHLFVSVIVGTTVGLVFKYMLDKRYIFRFRTSSIGQDTKTFVLYTIMGLATTLIFWGFEVGFHYIFVTKEMRYLGGVIGLAIGYLTKYHLDKRYVFRAEVI